eukprot:1680716-Rhodomonas_salina.1
MGLRTLHVLCAYVLVVLRSHMLPKGAYAMCGTEIGRAATGTDTGNAANGTDIGYAATRRGSC